MDDKHIDYEQPEIADYGDLAELTESALTGTMLDATFPSGTPFALLTFS